MIRVKGVDTHSKAELVLPPSRELRKQPMGRMTLFSTTLSPNHTEKETITGMITGTSSAVGLQDAELSCSVYPDYTHTHTHKKNSRSPTHMYFIRCSKDADIVMHQELSGFLHQKCILKSTKTKLILTQYQCIHSCF